MQTLVIASHMLQRKKLTLLAMSPTMIVLGVVDDAGYCLGVRSPGYNITIMQMEGLVLIHTIKLILRHVYRGASYPEKLMGIHQKMPKTALPCSTELSNGLTI
jgi:hypothetical protein